MLRKGGERIGGKNNRNRIRLCGRWYTKGEKRGDEFWPWKSLREKTVVGLRSLRGRLRRRGKGNEEVKVVLLSVSKGRWRAIFSRRGNSLNGTLQEGGKGSKKKTTEVKYRYNREIKGPLTAKASGGTWDKDCPLNHSWESTRARGRLGITEVLIGQGTEEEEKVSLQKLSEEFKVGPGGNTI